MSQSSYALGRRKLYLTRGVAGFLVVLLVAALALTASSLTAPVDDAAPTDTPAKPPAAVGQARPSEILTPSTASPTVDAAIAALVAAERFRFDLRMKPISGGGGTSWRVLGEADLATAPNDPPRLHAEVALGSGETYSVISDQIRVGAALFNRDPGSGTYEAGEAAGSEELGAVDPITTILASLRDVPASRFTEIASAPGTRTIAIRANNQQIEGDITTMRIVLDQATNALKKMRFRSEAMTSSVTVWDLGDPSIDIQLPR